MKRGWAKYFEVTRERAENARVILQGLPREGGVLQRPTQLPPHLTSEFWDMAEELNKTYTCPICIELVGRDTVKITFCGHMFHEDCYKQLEERANGSRVQCPVCRREE